MIHQISSSKNQIPGEDQRPFRVFAFGAGVQTMALLYAWVFDSIIMPRDVPDWSDFEGFFDGTSPDLVAFADTQCEPQHVYDAVEQARGVCEDAGVPFVVLTKGDLARPKISSTGTQSIYVPVYTKKLISDSDGKAGTKGQLRRQCTPEYKIEPVIDYAKTLAGDRPIEIILGISLEEAHRMRRRDPDDQVQLRYPLIENDHLGQMTRNDCINFLRDMDLDAAKSACVFCPYRRDAWWGLMYRNAPADFAKAVDYDRWVRYQRPGYECYVHDSLRPLEEVVPEIIDAEDTQVGLFPMTTDTSGSGGCESGFCGT